MKQQRVHVTSMSFNILDVLLRDRDERSTCELAENVFVRDELEDAFFYARNDDRSNFNSFYSWLDKRTVGNTAWFEKIAEHPPKYQFSEYGHLVVERFVAKDQALLAHPILEAA